MATVRGYNETTRNVWVTFDHALYESEVELIDMALDAVDHPASDFPFGASVARYSLNSSANVVFHKVDPQS